MTTETNNSYKFYSTTLRQVFDSVEALKTAETQAKEEAEKKDKLLVEKKTKADAIETAYKHSIEVRKECDAKIKEADKAYYSLRDQFVKDYGSFHMTYRDSDTIVEDSLFDFIKKLFF